MGIGDWAQSPIPNPQSPIPNSFLIFNNLLGYYHKYIQRNIILILYLKYKSHKKIKIYFYVKSL
ncbi:MAG: hypothetical protein MJ252_27805 [archaeon]|nr:hypothetical protein [archaeon]